jgi:hypothetical protein
MSRFTQLVDDIEQRLADSSVLFVIGNDNQKKRGPRRRIHWYRRGGPIVTNKRSGQGAVSGDRVTTPYVRKGVIEAHIFSENDDTTEQLLDNLLSAIFGLNNTGLELFDYDWDDDQINQRGCYCILRFTVIAPVTSEKLSTVIITGQETEKEFTNA